MSLHHAQLLAEFGLEIIRAASKLDVEEHFTWHTSWPASASEIVFETACMTRVGSDSEKDEAVKELAALPSDTELLDIALEMGTVEPVTAGEVLATDATNHVGIALVQASSPAWIWWCPTSYPMEGHWLWKSDRHYDSASQSVYQLALPAMALTAELLKRLDQQIFDIIEDDNPLESLLLTAAEQGIGVECSRQDLAPFLAEAADGHPRSILDREQYSLISPEGESFNQHNLIAVFQAGPEGWTYWDLPNDPHGRGRMLFMWAKAYGQNHYRSG